ncbi:NAC transcription factor 47-like [Vicia villosa]|uniref:NAC transcription factor 47-like n=1 Tax=Vicia villosa TaxID=3911 RepID=UPI00273C1098|nr:NAC transcription factor 47-like [Vicia villosa]
MAVNGYVDYDSIDCASQFPVGYRFDPTDDDLISFYLRKKIYKQPLPRHGILQFDVFQTEPWMLPFDTRNSFSDRRYYFFDLRNYRFENTEIRRAGNGEWRVIEKRKEVSLRRSIYFIGSKFTFEYWKMEGTQLVKSKWMMEEFRISPILHPHRMSYLGAYRVSKKKVTTRVVTNSIMEDENESANTSSP